ncbi:MAG TPA: hypothetical protein VLA21_09975, partial [Candidatus Limnocylindria bacterium]|nr:hypothetical protein [Candidatus Limnocylindria bacterium]
MSGGIIKGGRMSRQETSGDKRSLGEARMPRRQILRRLWQYMGRSRARLVLAVLLTLLSASLGLVGPRLSGLAIDATGVGRGQADIPLVL